MRLPSLALIVATTLLAPAFSMAQDAPKVTANNYVRAETDYQFKTYIDNYHCFGKFVHSRAAYDVNNQVTVRGNRTTSCGSTDRGRKSSRAHGNSRHL